MELKLVVDKLSFGYRGRSVLKDLTLCVNEGEILSIVGPNGSGKSTLLKCIDRILEPKRNTILVDDKDITRLDFTELSKLVGYVPQNSATTFPFTVFDVVLMGRRPYIGWSLSRRDTKIVAELLAFLGIEELAFRRFNELSGGEQQKVIVARALAQQPKIMLLDEPTSALDIRHQMEILCILKNLVESKERTVIVAMHDLNLAGRFSDQMLLVKHGEIFAAGTPSEVLTEANIETVYGVKCKVANSFLGSPQITPLASGLNASGKVHTTEVMVNNS